MGGVDTSAEVTPWAGSIPALRSHRGQGQHRRWGHIIRMVWIAAKVVIVEPVGLSVSRPHCGSYHTDVGSCCYFAGLIRLKTIAIGLPF